MGKSGTECFAFGCSKRRKKLKEVENNRSESDGTDDEESKTKYQYPRQQPFVHNCLQGSQSCQSPFRKRRRTRRPPYPRYSRRSRMKEWLTYLDPVRQVMRSNSFPKPNQYPILPDLQ